MGGRAKSATMLPNPKPMPVMPHALPSFSAGTDRASTGLQVATTMPPPIPWTARPRRNPGKLELSANASDPTTKQAELTAKSRPPQRAAAIPDRIPEAP